MLKELLDKWAASGDVALQDELEGTFVLKHPRCHEARPGEPDAWCVVHGGFWHGWRVNPDRPADHAHILAATIEAVQARGWLWQVGRLPSGSCWARVWDRGPDGEHVDRMNCGDGDPYRREHVEGPVALLSSYLAALEAES